MKIRLFGRGCPLGWELQRSLAVPDELVALDSDETKNQINCVATLAIWWAWQKQCGR